MPQVQDDDENSKLSAEESGVAKEGANKPATKVKSKDDDNLVRAVTLAVVAVGAVLVEVELLAGVALGAAAMAAPQIISAFRSGRKKAEKSPKRVETGEESAEAA